jgi:GNAT superfamily N-acetyltransferase
MNENYTVRELAEAEFFPLFDKYKQLVFEDVHSYSPQRLLTGVELQRIEDLGQGIAVPYKLFLGVFNGDNEFVGWSWGQQENSSTFYMVNSAVLPGHRRKGLYSALISKCIDVLSNKGFQIIYSRHCATNNAVIIPKLQANFIISAMEIDDKYGVLIHLRFYTNSDRRKVMDYRSGQLKPDNKMKQVFQL